MIVPHKVVQTKGGRHRKPRKMRIFTTELRSRIESIRETYQRSGF